MKKALELLYEINKKNILLWVEKPDKLKYKLLQELEDKQFWFEKIKQNKVEIIDILKDSGITSGDYVLPIIYKTPLKNVSLSFAQQRLYFIEQYEEGSNAYNIPISIKLDKNTDVEIFKKAIESVVNRHEILRTLIKEDKETNVYQEISKEQLLFNEHYYFSKEKLDNKLKEDVNRVFKLNEELPIYVGIYELKEEIYVLINIHHIAFDGWSTDIFFKEINEYYYHYKDNKKLNLANLSIGYKDFALWQRDYLQGEELDRQLTYWENKLSSVEPLGLRSDYQRPQKINYEGNSYQVKLDKRLSSNIIQLAKEKGVSLYTLLLSAFNILLSKYTNQEDIVIGSPTASRHYKQIEDVIGFFVNTLAIRNTLDNKENFYSFLDKVEQSVIEAQSHQDIPFEHLVDKLNIQRDVSRHPIFDVLFSFQSFGEESSPELFKNYNTDSYKISKFDLELFASQDSKQSLAIEFNYSISLFKSSTIQTMTDRYVQILEQITTNPEISIKDISLLKQEEYSELIYLNNQTEKEYPQSTIHEMFIKQAQLTPNNIVLVYEDKQLTYKELDLLSNQMARYIQTKTKMQSDTLIALCLDRSLEMIISILGVLKAGGAYVPVDPAYPDERIKYILEDTDTKIVLTQSHLEEKVNSLIQNNTLISVDKEEYKKENNTSLDSISTPNNLAYVIYTSGTTGKPKGVMVEHNNVNRLFKSTQDKYQFNDKDTWMIFHSFVFDFSVWEIWGALFYGGKLFIPSKKELLDTPHLFDLMDKHKVSVFNQTPSAFYNFISVAKEKNRLLNSLRYVIFGGEALNPIQLKPWFEMYGDITPKLINMYGITETTVHTTYKEISLSEISEQSNIGDKLEDLKTYILDANLKPVGKGITGELYIAGAGLARGYLNKEELTKERFINNPFASKEDIANGYTRMYKTGDLVRVLEDNNIEYIGRSDFQVKIRGYRIELGEIESVISKYKDIKQAVVLAKEKNNSKYLVAYYTSTNEIKEEELINSISKELAEYMIPTAFVQVDEFKLTVNGKLDTKSLPEPELKSEEYIAPSDELEIKICKIFKEVLNVEQVGIKDDFFKLGGNSILAISLAHKLSKALSLEIKVADIFNYKNVSQLIEHGLAHDTIHIPKVEQEKYPLSFAQQRLYFIEQYEEGSNAYNIPISIKLDKNTDVEIFKKAIESVVNRHEILRTLIKEDKETNVYQEISKEQLLFNEHYYFSKEKLDNKLKEDVNRVFKLNEELPIYVGIYELKEEIYVLINIHHIAFDGWSTDIFFKEINEYYYHYKDNKKLNLANLSIGYKDFALWQRDYLQGEELDRQLTYWENKLSSVEPLGLRSDYQRPQKINYEGNSYQVKLDKRLSSNIIQLAKEKGVSLYTLLLSAFNILLSKYTNQEDIVIGSPTASRHYKQIEDVIGFFVNTLAIRNTLDNKENFYSFLDKVEQSVIEAQSHQDIPFEHLVDKLNIQRDVSRHPIFDVLFSFQSFGEESSPELFKNYNTDSYKISKFDLELFASQDSKQSLAIEFNYSISLFKSSTIQTMTDRYVQILEQITTNPEISIKDISLLKQEEYSELIYLNNQTEKEYPQSTIHEMFIKQAQLTPNNIVLVYEDKQLTYKELDLLSNQMARYIQTKTKMQSDTLIALCLDRSLEMIISILGVLKAGGAYVPVDPAYPDERIKYILEDTDTKIVLTQSHLEEKVNSLIQNNTLISVDKEEYKKENNTSLDSISTPNNLAYVIYTSGTTGKPKGVMVEHRGIVNLVKDNNFVKISDKDCFLQVSTPVFDAATFEIWGALLNSAKLVLPKDNKELVRDTKIFKEFLLKHNVSILLLTKTLYDVLYLKDNSLFQSINYLLVGGEALNPDIIKDNILNPNRSKYIINGYGPTETTTFSTTYDCDIEFDTSIPIGKALNNTKTYILDTNLQPVPRGITGELYIAGAGLARGYLNKEELTKERFINNPFASKEDIANGYTRMYKTGDLVRVLEDNNIEYIGRSDFQVKIRGYRIELGEIESVISKYKDIKQAVVLAKEKNNSKYLVAYYTSTNEIKEEELINSISKELAEYMIPTAFVKVEEFKLTVNGKLDTKSLPEPELKSEEYIAPSDELEIKICKIFKEVLNVEQVGIKDDFFKLGGNSILAISLAHKLSKALSLEIKVADIFNYKNVSQLIEHGLAHDTIHIPKVEQEKYPLSFAQQRLYFIEQYEEGSNAYNIPISIKLDKNTDVEIFKKAIESVVNRHEILRTLIKEDKETNVYQEISKEQLLFNEHYYFSKEKLDNKLKEDVNRVFKLNEELPIYVGIYELKEEIYVLINIHHIAFDGWSTDIFFKEINEYYYHYKDNKKLNLANLSIGYKDFALWQRDYLQGEELDRQLTYWENKLSSVEPLGLRSDYQRPQKINYEGNSYQVKLDKRLSSNIIQLAKEKGVSLYTLLLSAFNILLSKYTNQEDIVIGSPTASRHYKQIEDVIGFFVNTLAIRNTLDNKENFYSFLDKVEQSVIEAQSHQDIPFEHLVDKLDIERDTSRHPIFDILFTFQNFSQDNNSLFSNNDMNSYKISKFDLELAGYQDEDQLIHLGFNYKIDLYKDSTIKILVSRYIQVIEQITTNPDILIKDISLLNQEEYTELIYTNNQTEKEYPQSTIHEMFIKQAQLTPNNIALVYEDKQLTYKELDELSNQMARAIKKEYKNIQKDSLVALCLDRSLEMIISILGVLKAGGAYVPIDPAYPNDRIEYILEDTNTKLVITQSYLKEKLKTVTKTSLLEVDKYDYQSLDNSSFDFIASPKDLAYVIYTSGTTGKPKGVMLEHHGVINLLESQIEGFKITSKDSVLQFASFSFDAAVSEIFSALIKGAKLLVVSSSQKEQNLIEYFKSFKEDSIVATIPPALLKNLKYEKLPNLKTIVVAGESSSKDVMDIWSKDRCFVNAYGPTESTVCATLHPYTINSSNTNIGKPLNNTKTYILDNNLQPVPRGITGELYIAGAGLARGYLNKEELTKERFINNPFASKEDIANGYTRMYKTGDLVRVLEDNNIEYIGRSDFQVKIRGYRIELGEIESVISKYKDIKQAVVLAKEKNNSKYLVAYYTSTNEIKEEELINSISKELAEYMIPTAFVKVEEFKLTVNGKLDTKSLPEPELKSEEYIAPSDELEIKICKIFKEVLNVEQVGIKDDFFKLGGNSILAISLAHKLSKALSLEIKVADLFRLKTVEKIIDLFIKRDGSICINSHYHKNTDFIQTAIDDSKILDIKENLPLKGESTSPQTALLTGASGFLGIYLLSELLQKLDRVVCLERCKDEKDGFQKISKQAQKAGLKIDLAQVEIICGDLSMANLGIFYEQREYLAQEIDVIVHCGAYVHHLHDYETMRAANVESTLELLDLALEYKRKSFCFVSTTGVATSLANIDSAPEVMVENIPLIDNGYILSKWVGENLVSQYNQKYGLDAVIARPGNITGCSVTGFSNFEQNHFWLFNKGCVQLGSYPNNISKTVEMVPVDIMAKAISALSLSQRNGLAVRNLSNPTNIDFDRFFSYFKTYGFNIIGEDSKEWQEHLKDIGDENALAQIKDFYAGDLSSGSLLRIDQKETLDELKSLGVSLEIDYSKLLNIYISFLRESGFLPNIMAYMNENMDILNSN